MRTDLNRLGKFRGKREDWKGTNIIKVQRNLQIHDVQPRNKGQSCTKMPKQQF